MRTVLHSHVLYNNRRHHITLWDGVYYDHTATHFPRPVSMQWVWEPPQWNLGKVIKEQNSPLSMWKNREVRCFKISTKISFCCERILPFKVKGVKNDLLWWVEITETLHSIFYVIMYFLSLSVWVWLLFWWMESWVPVQQVSLNYCNLVSCELVWRVGLRC